MHFTISGAKNIVRFTEDFAVWRFVIITEVPLHVLSTTFELCISKGCGLNSRLA